MMMYYIILFLKYHILSRGSVEIASRALRSMFIQLEWKRTWNAQTAVSPFLARQKQAQGQFVEKWCKHESMQNVNNDAIGLKPSRVYHTDVSGAQRVTGPINCTESGGWKSRMKGGVGNKTSRHCLSMGFD